VPTPHSYPYLHFWLALGLVGVTVALMATVRNHIIRRRLLFSTLMLVLTTALHLFIVERPGTLDPVTWPRVERLLIAFAIVNALVSLAFNPWFRDQVADRAPAIVQDSIVILLAVGAAFVVFEFSSFDVLASSAIVAAIAGFALQDTLGNAFAGIAIQIDKPFRVGHWIAVGGHEGLVMEVTWRATKIRTKAGNLVVVPNGTIAKESINNYSEPTAPTRVQIEVGCAYEAPPNSVREALLTAARDARYVLTAPPPEVLLVDFAASSINYRVRFWVDDFSRSDQAEDAVRTAIYYELGRRKIDIPYPIQVEYSRETAPADTPERREQFRRQIEAVPVLAKLPADAHQALAAAASEELFADSSVIVHEGAPGGSMFIVTRGKVVITIGPERREVAVTEAGGYFGEMSLLTGDPRTATVVARGDCTVLEISADVFRHYVQANPEVIDLLAVAATARRRELAESRASTATATAVTPVSLAERMRRFFGLS
jgi:small-conductance mechanosensitive channel/CRP-like cAMP-binding protein